MATPIVMQYETDAQSAIRALTAVIARSGYTLGAVDNQNGIVTFETGMSASSWAGQSMSAHILPTAGAVQITISGTRKPHGAQMQVTDFGEARGIATKIFEQLTPILGAGQLISGEPRHDASPGAVVAIIVVAAIALAIFAFVVLSHT